MGKEVCAKLLAQVSSSAKVRQRERESERGSVKSALETWAKSTKYVLCACTMFKLKRNITYEYTYISRVKRE